MLNHPLWSHGEVKLSVALVPFGSAVTEYCMRATGDGANGLFEHVSSHDVVFGITMYVSLAARFAPVTTHEVSLKPTANCSGTVEMLGDGFSRCTMSALADTVRVTWSGKLR
jgi:hypothetical protein